MALHLIKGTPVFIHELQSVMLISSTPEKPVERELVQQIVNEVVSDRDAHEASGTRNESLYHIQEPALGFDVFVRNGETLMQYSFTENGEFINNPPARNLNESGLFHFQFTVPEKPIESFHVDNEEYRIIRITAEEFAQLPIEKQNAMLDEISSFNKTQFPEHFELWELNDKDPEWVRDHFRHLQSSLSSLYVIRDKNDQMVAINGITASPDQQLTYQSMTITRTEDRGKGFMAVNLSRATYDYPEAVMTAYFVNPGIRNALGETAMTQTNVENHVASTRSNYLEAKAKAATSAITIDTNRAKQSAMKQELQEVKNASEEYPAQYNGPQ
ncbi:MULTISPECIES: hypothetical protein [Legionella]|uniref:Uncharacterized protein n=1 Tax=Legionella maceachernii TaxID=466 RepID=A0A0W0W4I2_9GAMM|nr:hypothetical protein [Legionella maceachernii]KTD27193.1 hypothetical protein Lmac_1441 [Legionella maceachernii]SKA13261.1 hypothetical protein SAMN02745128_02215 [Legionella maceachernii]SUP04752.1 Uncharacterised protein [Legionella maceachernii]